MSALPPPNLSFGLSPCPNDTYIFHVREAAFAANQASGTFAPRERVEQRRDGGIA